MSSHARSSREEERRLSVRTLLYASIGSATAAILTSQFWTAGTPVAAALTPVIVALVSELLHGPTERIAQRLTTDTRRIPETDVLPEAAGAGPPPKEEERRPRPAREVPPGPPGPGRPPPRRAGAAAGEPEFRVYRSTAAASRLPWKVILATAAIAFAIAAAVLTLPELIAGGSLSGGERDTTLFGGQKKDREAPAEEETTPEETAPAEEAPDEPDRTVTTPKPAPEETTPTTPGTTTQPAPAQPRGQTPTTPTR